MNQSEVIAIGTDCPLCGGHFFVPEPKYSKLIQQLIQVVRAAEKFVKYNEAEEWLELCQALEALPEHLRKEDA